METGTSQSFSNDIKQYTKILWHWAWLVVVIAILFGCITYYISLRQPKIYQASATLLIDQPQSTTDYASILANERIAQTYSQMIVQPSTLEGVIQRLELDNSVTDLKKTLQVQVIPETQLLELTLEDTDPQRAADIVNAIVVVFEGRVEELQASRYRETKDSLEAQMMTMDDQIQETTLSLDVLKDTSESGSHQDILQVQLDTYRKIYQAILTQIVQMETQIPQEDDSKIEEAQAVFENQLGNIETKITEITAEIEAMGLFPRGAQYEILKTELAAYQDLYQTLIRDLVSSQNNTSALLDSDGLTSESDIEALTIQLDFAAGRIQELTEEINKLGGSTDGGVERDRLESNLALYRQTYANLVQSYEQVRLAEIQNTSRVDLVQPATKQSLPDQPNVFQNTLLGLVLGLFMGVGAVFLIEILDDSVKGPEDINQHLELPVLGYISHKENKGKYPITALEPRSHIAESYRSLRTNIQYASVDIPLTTIMVTSPTPRDGKTTVIANLGVVLAQGKHQVAIIDADMRIPNQHNVFNLSNNYGLTDALIQSEIHVDGNMRHTEVPNLSVLTSGDLPHNPSELMSSNRMVELIQQLAERVDVILIDTPPVMAVTDPVILSTRVDGVIIVVRPGITKLGTTIHTVEQLRQVGANLLGVVLNDVENKSKRYATSSNGYYYGYGKYDDYISTTKQKKSPKIIEALRSDPGNNGK
jgi:non-specific protein-tyrosine kinase